MCGVVGIMDLEGNAQRYQSRLERASQRLAHRGPDGQGMHIEGEIALAFRRLAILDLSNAGDQPAVSQNGDWVVVFNGEIYNYAEMRQTLQSHGVTFRSTCDTEVLVEGLAHWGTACFERCNGMWAVLAWQRSTATLVACRDPWGIKPLYVGGFADKWIGFASEIKGLIELGCDVGGVDFQGARVYLEYGEMNVDKRTLFANVKMLMPGTLYTYRRGQQMRRQTMPDCVAAIRLPAFADSPSGDADYVDGFRQAFFDSVKLRMHADVDVGTCLSGGLDSSTIACIAAQIHVWHGVENCRFAFTATLPEFDESTYIKAVIEQTGAQWYSTFADDGQIAKHVERFFACNDQPVHSMSPLASYMVFALAKERNVRVLLNGHGGDEVLAGYDSTVLPYLRTLLATEGLLPAFAEAVAEGGSLVRGAGFFLSAQSGLALRQMPVSVENRVRRFLHERGLRAISALPVRDGGGLEFGQPRPRPPIQDLGVALRDQVRRFPLPMYLRIEDVNSSAHSLEVRLPFLDPHVAAFARAAPSRLLRHGGFNKVLLRRIMPGLVPDVVWQRRAKMGFPVPTARWLRGPLRGLLLDTTAEHHLIKRGWYDTAQVLRIRDGFLKTPDLPCPQSLVRIFLLERWAQDWLDKAAAMAS